MGRVLTAKTTKLLKLQTLRRFLLVFGCDVVAIFAIATLQNDVVSHNFPNVRYQASGSKFQGLILTGAWNLTSTR